MQFVGQDKSWPSMRGPVSSLEFRINQVFGASLPVRVKSE